MHILAPPMNEHLTMNGKKRTFEEEFQRIEEVKRVASNSKHELIPANTAPTIITPDGEPTNDLVNFEPIFDDFLGFEFAHATSGIKVDSDYDSHLRSGLLQLFTEGTFCDLILQANRRVVPSGENAIAKVTLHSNIASVFSSTIQNQLKRESNVLSRGPSNDLKKTIIHLDPAHVDGNILLDIVKYMYEGSISISLENADAVLVASCHLQLRGLIRICCDFLKSNLDTPNILSIVKIAITYRCEDLERAGMEFFDRNFVDVSDSKGWRKISKTVLHRLLSRNDVHVAHEIDIFRAVVKWVGTDTSRRGDFEQLILDPSIVRLANMSRNDLIEVSKHSLVENSDVLRGYLYNEAMRRVQNLPAPIGIGSRRYVKSNNQLVNSVCERTLTGHTAGVVPLSCHENYLISGSNNGQILIWDMTTWTCVNSLLGHCGSVVALKMCGDKLVSGSQDQTIRVWNLNSFVCEAELYGNTSAICALAVLNNRRVCSGSHNGMIMVYDSFSWDCEASFKAHEHVIWALVECGNKLVSGSSDTTIKVWNTDTWVCEVTLRQHVDEVQALVVSGDLLVSGSDDGIIKVWDQRNWICLRTLSGHNKAILSLAVQENMLISGFGNGDIKFWDLDTLECCHTLTGHTTCVMGLLVWKDKLVSSSYDKTIKLWGQQT